MNTPDFIGLLGILGIVRLHNAFCGQLTSWTFLAYLDREHLSHIVQPYALRAPEVILGLGWGPAIDIWSLGCMVLAPPLAYPLYDLLTISFLKMYEFAMGHWLFSPKAKDDTPRDVVHLAQMTQRTGHDHDDAALKQYETRVKRTDLKGEETHPKIPHLSTLLTSRLVEACN